LLVHIGDPSSNQATTLESQMIHMIQELFGQTVSDIRGAGGFGVALKASEAVARWQRQIGFQSFHNCFQHVWSDFATACLRNSGSEAKIVEARLVTSRR